MTGKLLSFHPLIPDCRPPDVHSFANTSVRCQCGSETWPETLDKGALQEAGWQLMSVEHDPEESNE